MGEIALGVTVFKRIEKLETLLASVDHDTISHVYVADDGEMTDRKCEVYHREYEFPLTVFDLPFDAGLGAGRNRIVEAFDEEYFLLVDSDMEVPHNVDLLREQIAQRPSVGGICGMFLENDRFYTPCSDLFVESNTVVKDIRERKRIESVAGAPFVEFDFVANAALFRRECLEAYAWDPEYVIGREHIDFYFGHYRETDWRFGLCPEVQFPHHPGGTQTYEAHRFDADKYDEAERYFLDKWNLDGFVSNKTTWVDTHDPVYGRKPPFSLLDKARMKYRTGGLGHLLFEGLKYVVK
ncbi:glycosyltransferase family 2 protein [Haloarcula halophila]|uniref:glycosyltransferase family 2 protein n=1 Tax=Haloarcula TaxID=2237 RepID=UPI0023E3FDE0|nr:glycosyltransferase family A protein [Halomicroarcula sp. DFY41]